MPAPTASGFASVAVDGSGGGWQEYIDPKSGNPYYYNLASRKTQWERPASYTAPLSSGSAQAYTAREVPADPLSRAAGFAALGMKLAAGAAAEAVSRATVGGGSGGGDGAASSALLSEANAATLAAELCRMRGAALKVGQMLSLQDSQVLPAPLAQALDAVRCVEQESFLRPFSFASAL